MYILSGHASSFEAAKRFFDRTANSIFGKIGRIASEETLQLIRSKCIPALFYGLEACPMNKSDLKSLDFAVGRVFMKLFKTVNIEIVSECQKILVLTCSVLCSIIDVVNLLVRTMVTSWTKYLNSLYVIFVFFVLFIYILFVCITTLW